jgi:hypothetical protein
VIDDDDERRREWRAIRTMVLALWGLVGAQVIVSLLCKRCGGGVWSLVILLIAARQAWDAIDLSLWLFGRRECSRVTP